MEEANALLDARQLDPRGLQATQPLQAGGEDDRGVLPGQLLETGSVQEAAGAGLHAQVENRLDLLVQDRPGQAILGDAGAQHPAELGLALVEDRLLAGPGQVVGRRQTGRPAADDRHPVPGTFRAVVRPGNPGLVRHPALQGADVHRAVVLGPVAALHAGRRTDPAADPGQGRAAGEHRAGGLGTFPDHGLDEADAVVAGGTPGVAGREVLGVDGHLGPPGTGLQARGQPFPELLEGQHLDRRRRVPVPQGDPVLRPRQLGDPHLLPGLPGGGDVAPEAEGPVHLLEELRRQLPDAHVGAGDGGVDDDHRAGADAVPPGDGRGVDRGDTVPRQEFLEGLRWLRRVEEHQAVRPQAGQDLPAHQGRVQDQDLVRLVDLVPVLDGRIGNPGVGPDRGTAALTGVVPEGLDALP